MAFVVQIVLVLAVFVFGVLFGWLASAKTRRGKLENAQANTRKLIEVAEAEAEALKKTAILEARDEWRRERVPLEREEENTRLALRELENRLQEREQQLDRKVDILENKERSLNKQETLLARREEGISAEEAKIEQMIAEQRQRLERLAGMTQTEARHMIIAEQEDRARQLASRKVREIKDQAIANGNREAREIIARAIQRFAGEMGSESTVTVLNLPSEEMKGRIIGRDGRNIRSFEMITGVEIIVDDTPGMVMLSSFDLLRRQIAKNALDKLIVDGRIHPGRIEEVYEKARDDIEEMVRESGSKAAFDLGIHDLSEGLLELLGKLRFRTSYSQNLLTHSKEVGLLAGVMASELDLDSSLARRAGLLHEIDKAIDHENGAPPQAVAALLRKAGEPSELIEIIETYNSRQPNRSSIAVLIEAANEISTNRPGACNEKAEDYIKRLSELEEIATSFHGVRRAYALQNGREIRVLVDSAIVDDAYADQMADDIAEKLENEASLPGQIKVMLVREVRAVHHAR
jgi:ribonucrease Y